MSRRIAVTICLCITGCTYVDERRAAAPAPPPQRVARYMPPADQYVRSKLLDFDSPLDTTFVRATGVVKIIEDPARAGNRVLSTAEADIKLGSLVRGREFPGVWDLLGIRVRSESAASATASIIGPGGGVMASTPFTAGRDWTMQWVELKALPTSMPSDSELRLAIASTDGKPLMIDEVILAQSRTVVSQSSVPKSGEAWRVGRSALRWQVMAGEEEVFSLPAAPFVENGYRVLESNPVRTVFGSPTSTIAIDRTGRLIENGMARVDPKMTKFAKATAENASPAVIDVAAEQGRVERNLPGDADNDGFDESRGCYTVRATGPRLNLRLTPQKLPVRWPIVEVIGLPSGSVSVWVEGQLVPFVTRLSDGKTIIELPVTLERAVEVQIRVK